MNALVSLLLSFWWVIAPLVMIVSFRVWVRLFGVVMIPEDSMGVVNKMFALVGAHKTLPDGTIIALNGEAGYQADTLAPGLHFGNWPCVCGLVRTLLAASQHVCVHMLLRVGMCAHARGSDVCACVCGCVPLSRMRVHVHPLCR